MYNSIITGKKMKSFDVKDLSVLALQNVLQNTIAPRPIAFASTISGDGKSNLSPFSFFNIFSANPPILIFSPARSGRDATPKDTLLNMLEVPEVVINMVNFEMAEQISLASVSYPRGISEFEKSGFTKQSSDVVKPFRVKQSPVQFECKVNDIIKLGEDAGAGNLVICEVLKIHIATSVFDEKDEIDPLKLDLIGRMGGSYYVKTLAEALFEIPKPIGKKAMGIDALPDYIKQSQYLTGSELARLAGVDVLPEKQLPTHYLPQEKDFLQAKNCIAGGKIVEAFAYLY